MLEVAVTVVNVLAAAAAVGVAARRGRRPVGRLCPIVCFLGLSVVAVLTLALGVAQAPRYELLLGVGCAAAIFAAWFGALFLERRSDDDDDDGGGGGRGPGGRGRGPRPSPGPAEPWWWGQFEREFRTYRAWAGQSDAGGRPGRSGHGSTVGGAIWKRRQGEQGPSRPESDSGVEPELGDTPEGLLRQARQVRRQHRELLEEHRVRREQGGGSGDAIRSRG